MKRGFLFTFAALSLFSLLLVMAANSFSADSRSSQLIAQSTLRKVSYAWDDINDDLYWAVNASVSQDGTNLTIGDGLPASHDLLRSLTAYGLFVQNYYRTPDINVSYLSISGPEIPLWQLGPPLQVTPFGMNYSYPDFGKNELIVQMPTENFSFLKQVHLNFTLAGNTFTDSVSNACSLWSPLKQCKQSTTNCFNLTVRITDSKGTLYNNAGCSSLDAGQNSNLNINLNDSGGNNGWIRVQVGKTPDLIDVKFQNANASVNSTFAFNSTDYQLNAVMRLRVSDLAFNASKTDSPHS